MIHSVLRSLARHPLYTAINLAGLSLGIAVFLTMALIVRYETGYDGSLPETGSLYRLDQVWTLPGRTPEEIPGASFVAAPFLRQDFPAVTDMLRLMTQDQPVHVGPRVEQEETSFTDPGFFSFFRLRALDGDPRSALSEPADIAIPASIARKYFGTVHAVGRTMRIAQDARPSIVTLVYADLPLNATYHFGIIERFPADAANWEAVTHWGSTWGQVFVRIPDARALPAVRAGLRRYMARHPGADTLQTIRNDLGNGGLTPVPFRAMHFRDARIGAGTISRTFVTILGLVGLAALVTAGINYINLATACASLRAREIAVRKVLGATRAALVRRFVAEAMVLTAVAAFCGLALCEMAIHLIGTLGGWQLTLDPLFCGLLCLATVLVVGAGAGFYPAMVLSTYAPAPVLAASRMPAGGRMGARLRAALVTLQFGFAIGLAICTLVMTDQAQFVRMMARGITTSGLIVVTSATDDSLVDRQGALRRALGTVPGVTGVERSDIYPHFVTDGDTFSLDTTPQNHASLNWGFATQGYADLYGLKLLAGRWFDPQRGEDFRGAQRLVPSIRSVVLSRAAVERLGIGDPQAAIGRLVRQEDTAPTLRVIGVIDDPRLNGPHERVRPLLFYGLRPDDQARTAVAIHVRFAGASAPDMLARLRAAWIATAPDVPFAAETVANILAEDSRSDREHGLLFGMGAGISVGIAALGLYGLSLFTVSRRRHEIGIRKVLGARAWNVLALLVGQFLRPVLLANLIAWPVAWVLMRSWLNGFDQRIALTPWPFVEATLSALLIGYATVIAQTLRAARQPPATALRDG
ncbi:ABC transporter permease [Gluconacetobacter takamatsuzukensis]|uniref:Transmembrane transport protein n=1 Tax=Gluconacetobacter takamatsuzukensis TaxID=1286190 RepID=A0A7W4PQ06_9PROT|nr:ABC transporter permease [Gluconacetobacter takamatsuzukensis]MBB2206167.1 transmembrane transport protein [Gluconacetobacter takamatsuzukensis]